MKISLLHPSRSRPEKSYHNSKEWIENAGCEVELIVSLDKSDPLATQYHNIYILGHAEWVIQNDNKSVVEATNRAAKIATGDILLYLSDDFKCFPDWGKAVLKAFEGEHRPLLIKVDDCLQPFDVAVLTIPIMNRALYERLGYFWHPEYKSMFVDEDLYWTVHRLGAMKKCRNIKLAHEHPCIGKAPNDETYKRSAANWDQGKATFARRKRAGFPL